MNSDEINSVAISFFSCFLFHQEVFSSKNYRAFGFRLADKQLTSSRRITICQLECTYSIKICSFSFFRIRSAIAQQKTSHFCQYCTSFGVFIRLELDVQLYLHFPPSLLSMQISTSRDQIFHQTLRSRRKMIPT